jgi:hypothetical protein
MKSDVGMSRLAWGKQWLMFAPLSLAVVVLLGCGGAKSPSATGGQAGSDDEKAIRALVGGVADMSSELERLRESFTKESAPREADRVKYHEHMFAVSGTINVTGDSASFPVSITPNGSETSVEKQWKATKVAGKWKLSEAPLP